MSDLPQPLSYDQIQGDQLSTYAAKQGISDFNTGSAVTSLFETVSLAIARSSGDIFQILNEFSIDRATGDSLQRLAAEYNITPRESAPATGIVSVIDSSFNKISTKIYAGTQPPNIGSTTIFVGDASAFPNSGSLYIGRGTPNIEGPIAYTAKTPVGNYWSFTLVSGTTKFHNLSESVILAQGGNRSIPANTIVISPATGANLDIQYSVTTSAIILDGETEVDNIPVTALLPGSNGNVPIGSITQFASPPFSGATVTNPISFTTGSDTETDDELRVQIKRVLASIGLGTATAVKNSLIGATASDESATIVSDSLVTNTDGSATVYIDDGTGYEAKTAGVGIESIVDSATGGQKFFQLATGGTQAPVAKAFLQTTISAPFDLVGGDVLAVVVGGQTYQHTFSNTDFRSPGGATSYEVTASINADTTLGFEATTSGNGTFVVIRAIQEENDSIQVIVPNSLSGRDAGVQLGFPTSEAQTLRLYKNNIPLTKDGTTASIFTQAQQLWSPSIQQGDTLILSVDGTSSITYTVNNADFIALGFPSVSSTNSLDSWAQVFNNKLTGVTASVVGQQLKLSSNLGASNRAQLSIDVSSSLVTKNMFSSSIGLVSQGKASDFKLDRNTAQFELAVALVAGDTLAAGTTQTQASIQSNAISGGSINFTSDGHLWVLVDSSGTLIQTGVTGNTFLAVSKPSTNVVRYTSTVPSAFSDVLPGDYVIIWSDELDPNDRIEGRVNAVTGTTLDILITSTEWAAIVTTAGVLFLNGFVVLRSTLAPQKFKVAAGNKTLDQISQELQLQSDSLTFSVLKEQFLVITSATKGSEGSVLIVTADDAGQLLDFTNGSSDESKDSLIAFYDNDDREGSFPLFLHSSFASEEFADPIDSFISSFDSAVNFSTRDPNELIRVLHPYGSIPDAQPYNEIVQESSLSGVTVNITTNDDVRRFRLVDRFFLASPFDFGHNDTAVVILDNNPSQDTFEIPFYRHALTNTSFTVDSNNFNAYDFDFGPTGNFVSSFGSSFDFSNFKVLMQAKKVLKPTPSQTAILYRAAQWGRSGEKITVGYSYPSAANSPIGNAITVESQVSIYINLKSGAAVATSIDNSTKWNITVTANTPSAGIDQVTYTWSGVGTNPNLSLSGGEYVNISTQTAFNIANTGIFRVSTQGGFTPTATSFSVQMPNGVAVPQSGVSTLVNGAIVFYASSSTTAAEINTYVNANLSNFFSGTLVNDGGTSGSGIIVLSTYEDSGFTYRNVQLLDGINWLESSALSGSPQFVLKKALSLPSDVGYAFNNGENIVFSPTTIDQIDRFLSVLAVTGFTTLGSVNTADRGLGIELSTNTIGGQGAIQIIGGTANGYSFPVLDSAIRFDNVLMAVSANNIASTGIESDQWFRLQASVAQIKETLISDTSDISIFPNNPSFGQSTIRLENKSLTQRYFGKPRNNIRSRGDTFRIEKQGSLVCLSWDNIGTNPQFVKNAMNFNASGGGTLNVNPVLGSSDSQYIILTGNANFTELSIGDLITVSGLPDSGNNGTFLVTGISDNGKVLQVLNPDASAEFSSGSFTLVTNSSPGDAFTVDGTTLIAGTDFTIGGTAILTAANLAAAIGAIADVTASSNSNVVTIVATIPSASIAISYAGTGTVTVSGASLVGDSYNGSTFSASSGVTEGDTLYIAPSAGSYVSPFSPPNQGLFRVIREYNNSIWFENADVVEEEVALSYNSVALGFDSSTSFKVNASNHSQYLNWNGVGTEPTLGNAQVGDVVTFGTDFTAVNRGSFMVSHAGAKLQEITDLSMPTGSLFPSSGPGAYFFINSAGDVNQYYVWFNVSGGSNTDPAPIGFTGLQVTILSGDNATQVATKAAVVLNGATGLDATSLSNVVTVTTIDSIETTDATNSTIPAPFVINVLQQGRRTFLECINPSAVNQSAVFVSTNILECHRPQMQFFEYEATVPGDQFVISGNALGASNAGSYTILRVIDQENAIISTSLSAIDSASLSGLVSSVYVQEGIKYSGYKHVSFVTFQPGTANRDYLVFDTNNQSDKINQSANVELTSINKLSFNTAIKQGLDSYKYNTGLIREANRIVYGDPRDPVTYPGVGAAGADIFIREPLTLRVQVSIAVRLNTGVPFAQMVDQVRSNVGSLINSNPVGQPIAISSIVDVVSIIPGVQSVAISSPRYDVSNDLIFLAPSEKAYIISPSADISVSLIT